MRLPDELMHLRMRGQMNHEIGFRVLHSADASGERGIVPREILQQVTEIVRPGVEAFVDAEDVVTFTLQALREVRPDLAARACDEDAHQAATGTAWAPRRVIELASSMRTSTSSPGAAVPEKLTVVFRRVRPRSSS
jgi:hypothetical protein